VAVVARLGVGHDRKRAVVHHYRAAGPPHGLMAGAARDAEERHQHNRGFTEL
jgi:hypothetical protein